PAYVPYKPLTILAGGEPLPIPTAPEFKIWNKEEMKNFKIGVIKEFMEVSDEKIRERVERAIEVFRDLNWEVVELSYRYIDLALPTYYLINYVEFFSATRKYDGRRYGYPIEEVCGEEVLRRIMIGRHISKKEYSGKYYKRALQARRMMKKEMLKLFKDVDAIVSPTVPKLPHKIGEKLTPMEMYSELMKDAKVIVLRGP
ncbi:MAG TPA: hypothetical protein EYP08_02530, partial [Pyrodictiaceae archaeon]|nr:hypothetical protein [Pyrodictiaceae archaeon]